jgi:NAD(P)H-dependent FMN reductase
MKKWLLIVSLVLNLSLAAEAKVLAFAGSTRDGSYNKKLVQEAAEMARQQGASVTVIDLKDYPMPFYDADIEAKGLPKNVKAFRDLMINSDFIMIACPEYNSSIPGLLKNALDWASRKEKSATPGDAFRGKKFAIMSASPGRGGGARALVHLRAIIDDAHGEVIEEQLSVPNAASAFNEKEKLISLELRQQLQNEVQALLQSKM